MTKTYCDRCGTELIDHKHRRYILFKNSYGFHYSDMDSRREYELCVRCFEEIEAVVLTKKGYMCDEG